MHTRNDSGLKKPRTATVAAFRVCSEAGQTLVIFVLALATLGGLAAITIDVGEAYVDRRHAQNGSDAASLAGADVLLEGGTSSEAVDAALAMAVQNGYDVSQVTVNHPPASGPSAGDTDAIEVIIEDQHTSRFAQLLDVNFLDVKTRAVAGVYTSPGPYSIITLDEHLCKAFEVDGQVEIIINGAGTLTNADCATAALYTEGTITINSDINDVVGGSVVSGTVNPPPSRIGQIEDPLAGLEPPTPPSGPVHPCPSFSGPPGTKVLEPGVYNCTIDPSGQWNLVFEPGDYLLGGGILMDGGGSVEFGEGIYTVQGIGMISTGKGDVSGSEVMFYIDEGQLQMTGTGDVDLSAPTSGYYEGILFFYNRALTSTIEMSGNNISDGWGTVYAANAGVDFAGSATTSYQFTVKSFYAHGATELTINYQDGFDTVVPRMHLLE